MAQGSNQIGEAFVDLRLRMDRLEADAAQANQKLQAVVERLENVAENTDKSARASGGWAASLVGVWNVYNSIVGTMRTALSIGESIGRLMVVNTERVDQFITDLSGAESRVRAAKTNKEILDARNKLRFWEDADNTGAPTQFDVSRPFKYAYAYFAAGANTRAQLEEELKRLELTQQLEVGGKMSAEAAIAQTMANQGPIMDFRGNVAGMTANVNGLRESIDRLNETMRSLPR